MGLSKGEIAAIAAASSLAFLALLGILAFLFGCYKRRQRSKVLQRRLSENPRLSIRPPTRISWAVGNLGTTQVAHGQRWSAPGRTPMGFDQPAPAYDLTIAEIPRHGTADVDLEGDSGIGHGIKKKEALFSLPILKSEPLPEASVSSRSRSRPLARLSGWFTSSSSGSQSPERRTANTSLATPRPLRPQEAITVLTQPAEKHGSDDDLSHKETYLDIQVSRTSPFQIDFE